MKSISAAVLLKNVSRLNILVVDGAEYLDGCGIVSSRVQRPGLALAGYFEHIRPNRVQLFGETEFNFLQTLPAERQANVLDTLAGLNRCLFVVSKELPIPASLLTAAKNHKVPVVTTAQSTVQTNNEISYCLDYALAPEAVMHGVCLEVCGLGVIILGKSGIGKSECALELVKNGHRLVADDIIRIKRRQHYIVGASDELLRDHIELRGVGILNLSDMFGITAIRQRKKIDLVIDFMDFDEWNRHTDADRAGLSAKTVTILDVPVPHILCPVSPGRNMAEIVELAAKNQLLKLMGHDSSKMFTDKMQTRINANRNNGGGANV